MYLTWRNKQRAIDLTYAIVLVILLDVVSCNREYKNNNNTVTEALPPSNSYRHCQPMPSEVLWRRINPKQSYEEYLNRTRDVALTDLGIPSRIHHPDINANIDDERNLKRNRKARSRKQKARIVNYNESGSVYKNSFESLKINNQKHQHPPGHLAPTLDVIEKAPSRNRVTSKSRKKRRDREKTRKARSDMPPWHCRLDKFWKKMSDGIFPSYVQTGRCISKTCMMGMYECRPKRYAVNVLKRNEGICNPLPLVASSLNMTTYYEESWTVIHHKVTVACECSKPRNEGTFYKKASAEDDITA